MLQNDFEFVSKYYDDLVRKSTFLSGLFAVYAGETFNNRTELVEFNTTMKNNFDYFLNGLQQIETNLVELERNSPNFLDHFISKMKKYNSVDFCTEVQKDVENFPIEGNYYIIIMEIRMQNKNWGYA